MAYQTLKQLQISESYELVMLKSTELSYYTPQGKARLGTKTKYDCVIRDIEDKCWEPLGLYNMTSKAEANKAFKELKELSRK